MNRPTKYAAWSLVSIYALSVILQTLFYIDFWPIAKAETQVSQTNLVAVFVDSQLQNNISDEIRWYAQTYLQSKQQNTKALVFPISKDWFKAQDIQAILENLYFEGQKWASSRLDWVILVWDIPLPVVKKWQYIFPTVYPYVDFEDKKYIYDKYTQFFEAQESANPKVEIWHSLIKANDVNGYKDYFNRLKTYASNPLNFVAKKIFYEDFVLLRKNYNPLQLPYYAQKFLFLEDLAYKRYNQVWIDILNGNYKSQLTDQISGFSQNMDSYQSENEELKKTLTSEFADTYGNISDEYFSKIQGFADQFFQTWFIESSWTQWVGTPSLLLEKVITSLSKSYIDMFSPAYIETITNNILLGWRWNEEDIDTHIQKTIINDEIAPLILKDFNAKLQDALDKYLLDNQYIASDLLYVSSFGEPLDTCDFSDVTWKYENFYFWKSAEQINNAKEYSIYRWTYLNLTGASQISALTGLQVDDPIFDQSLSSVGASLGIFQRQIEANRGYNYSLADADSQLFQNMRCDRRETMDQWVQRFWWWASPLNVTQQNWETVLKSFDFKNAWTPSTLSWVWGSLFDMTAARLSAAWSAYGYLWKDAYGSAIQTQKYKCERVWLGFHNELETPDYCREASKVTKSPANFDFFTLYTRYTNNSWTRARFHITNWTNTLTKEIWAAWSDGYDENLDAYYKVISSASYYKSPASDEINSMGVAATDRPIDDPMYIHFKSVSGQTTKLLYPDLFNVQLYTKNNDFLTLKSKPEIEEAVKSYLKSKIDQYNQTILAQNAGLKQALSSIYATYAAWRRPSWSSLSLVQGWSSVAQNKAAYEYLLSQNIPATNKNMYEFLKKLIESASFSNGVLAVDGRTFSSASELSQYVDQIIAPLPANMFVDVLGQEYISTIANNLYYINSAFHERKVSSTIQERLDTAKDAFDVNKRIKTVVDNYYKSNAATWMLANPTYNLTGYEVWFVNSDWVDALYDDTQVPSVIDEIQRQKNEFKPTNQDTDFIAITAQKEDNECWVSRDGTVAIWQWPAAFQCRLQKTISKPVSIKFGYSCSLASPADFGVFQSSEEQLARYSDNLWFASTLRTAYNDFTQRYNASLWDEYIRSLTEFVGLAEIVNEWNQKKFTVEQEDRYFEIKDNLVMRIVPNEMIPVYSLDARDSQRSFLQIDSNEDIGNLSMTFSVVWSNCFLLNNVDACRRDVTINVNPYVQSQLIPIDFIEYFAGQSIIQAKICDQEVCYYQDITTYVTAWEVSRLEILPASDAVIKWGQLPIKIQGYDAFNNEVSQNFWEFQLSVDVGWFRSGNDVVNTVSINNFDDAYYIFDTAGLTWIQQDELDATFILKPSPDFEDVLGSRIYIDKKVKVVNWEFRIVWRDGLRINDINIQLPQSKQDFYFYDNNWVLQVNPNQLYKLRLYLESRRGLKLSSPVELKSWQDQFNVGKLVTENISLYSGSSLRTYPQLVFKPENEFIIEDGYMELYLLPTFKAGKWNLTINIPWIGDTVIPYEVRPARAQWLSLTIEKEVLETNQTIWAKATVQDVWWNKVDNFNGEIEVTTIWEVEVNGQKSQKVVAQNGEATFNITTRQLAWKSYVYATLAQQEADSFGDYKVLFIKNTLWPKDNVNAMYYNLFGSDWWNLWWYFSQTNNIVSNMFSTSPKLLSLTTMLTSPQNIKKISFLVREDLKLYNLWNYQINVFFQSGKIIARATLNQKNMFDVDFGNISDYRIEKQDKQTWAINENKIVYLADTLDSTIHSNLFQDGQIKINDQTIINFADGYMAPGVAIVLSSNTYDAFSSFNITLNSKKVWDLIIARNDGHIRADNLGAVSAIDSSLSSWWGFAQGTTNGKKWIMIYDPTATLASEKDSNNAGIQWSIQPELGVGFKQTFANITDFAQWASVWNATKNYQSEFMVNFWDPLIQRVDKNQQIEGIWFDGWVWKRIFSDPNKSILKAENYDFNNDWLEDVAVWYKDWTIRLLKNYWGKEPFTDLWELMVIADWVKDFYVADVDGNWYKDIIVWTNSNKLRVYKNDAGIFGVDWNQICLDVPNWPDSVASVTQLFFEDMNQDWATDIVSNDAWGDIKIFYWGSSIYWDNYVSRNVANCDDTWDRRIKQKLVKSYWMEILDWQKIYDDSLIHRQWLQNSYDITLSATGVSAGDQDPNSYESIKQQELPRTFKPSYERTDRDSTTYAASYYLDDIEPVDAYKTFRDINGWVLQKWDKVEVTINLYWRKSTYASYVENLRWPFIVDRNDAGAVVGFDKGGLNNDVIINRTVPNDYLFFVDNIFINPWQTITFSYQVEYEGGSFVKIALDDVNKDNYQDIKVYGVDSCLAWYFLFTSDKWEDFDEEFVNVKDKYEQKINTIKDNYQKIQDDAQKKIMEISKNWDIWSVDFKWIYEKSNDKSFLNYVAHNGLGNIQIDLGIWWESLNNIQQDAKKALKWLCSWFKFNKDDGSCPKVPMPINMAFLAPWIGGGPGCFAWLAASALGLNFSFANPWVPVLWFPWTLWVPTPTGCIPVPVPNAFAPWGTPTELAWPMGCPVPPLGPSQFRLYLSPTTTMSLWVSACFGPYLGWMSLPPPFNMIAGNCVVAATPLTSSSCGDEWDLNTDQAYEEWQADLANMGQCKQPAYNTGKAKSPFAMVGSQWWNWYYETLPSGSFLNGFLQIDSPTTARRWANRLISFDSTTDSLKWWEKINLKISQWGMAWLAQCILQKWIDKQIRYIINNLTRMTLYIYLPDLDQLINSENGEFTKLGKSMQKLWTEVSDIGEKFNGLTNDLWDAIERAGNSVDGLWDVNSLSDLNSWAKSSLPSKNTYAQLSEQYGNPFESMSHFFDEVQLIQIDTREILVKVPFIKAEDIVRQISYLQGWLDRNKANLDKWKDLLDNIEECATSDNQLNCIPVNVRAGLVLDLSKTISAVEQNIKRLQEYKDFPLKLYNYIHIVDRIIYEITCVIEKLVDSLIGWLNENAKRFEKWVDAIILMISIIKTWQILIDVIANWKPRCGKCTVDTYDTYDCILWLLCIDLPILPIPPFKIPDIYLDFSHIDLWVDVLLPRFKFRALKIPLFKLPDIPDPMSVSINADFNLRVSIPEIPVLPAVPTLPEIPSFIPTLDIDLPVLPPAPKIPAIMPMIKVSLQIIEFVQLIWCIIKGNIWLVAENDVKRRVEQLTQRTWRMDPFDFLGTTIVDPPLKGFDIKVTSYIKLRFNFDSFYRFAKNIAQDINKTMSKVESGVAETAKDYNSYVNEVNRAVEPDNIDIDIRTDFDTNNGLNPDTNVEVNGIPLDSYVPSEIKDVVASAQDSLNYDDAYSNLLWQLQHLQTRTSDPALQQQVKDVVAYMQQDAHVQGNYEGLKALKTQSIDYLSWRAQEYRELAQKIKYDYDGFLDSLEQDELIAAKVGATSFTTQLWNWSKELVESLKTQEHPYYTYAKLNEQNLIWFQNSLSRNTPDFYGMTDKEYTDSKKYVAEVLDEAHNIQALFGEKEVENAYRNVELPAATTTGAQVQSSVPSSYMEFSQYIKWLFIKWESDHVNVIYDVNYADAIRKKSAYKVTDMNADEKDDVLMWDDHNIYIKYWQQDDTYGDNWNVDDEYYLFDNFDNYDDLKNELEDGGYLRTQWLDFKISSSGSAVDSLQRFWNSPKNISISWNNTNADGYLLKLSKRVDYSTDHIRPLWNIYQDDYILIVGADVDEKNTKLEVEDAFEGDFIYDYKRQRKIQGVYKTDITDTASLSTVLAEISKQWHYARVMWLQKQNNTFVQISPWWKQVSMSMQIWADKQAPDAAIQLVRTQNWQITSQGTQLKWFINTRYNMIIEATDTWAWVASVKLKQWETELRSSRQNRITLDGLYFTKEETQNYTLEITDNVGNIQNQQIVLEITVPEIEITNVEVDDRSGVGNIQANISDSVDGWEVVFERQRLWEWEVLTWLNQSSLFSINPQNTVVDGDFANGDNNIVLFNESKQKIATINLDSSKINVNDSRYDIGLSFWKNQAMIIISQGEKVLYEVTMASDKLVADNPITVYGQYSSQPLEWNSFKNLSWGTCIKTAFWPCVAYIDTRWNLFLDSPYNNSFSGTFSQTDEYTIYSVFDQNKQKVVDIKFIPKKFTNE